jgi:hypothetical protein
MQWYRRLQVSEAALNRQGCSPSGTPTTRDWRAREQHQYVWVTDHESQGAANRGSLISSQCDVKEDVHQEQRQSSPRGHDHILMHRPIAFRELGFLAALQHEDSDYDQRHGKCAEGNKDSNSCTVTHPICIDDGFDHETKAAARLLSVFGTVVIR